MTLNQHYIRQHFVMCSPRPFGSVFNVRNFYKKSILI